MASSSSSSSSSNSSEEDEIVCQAVQKTTLLMSLEDMKKKLDTRFPAVRIKKIMQADEDVGKIAMAVPVLVSKALELFLQDLCDRTYEITVQRGAKTLNSMHLKQCVQSFNVFDFLRDIVSKVPDVSGSDAAGEDRSASKRRKAADGKHNDGDEESKRVKLPVWTVHNIGSGSGKGRGRGRGRGRISRAETEANATAFSYDKHEINPDDEQKPKLTLGLPECAESKQNHIPVEKTEDTVKLGSIDLNLDLDENGNTPVGTPSKPTFEMKPDEYHGWSLMDVGKMAIDPVKLCNLNSAVDEDDDYDEEG